MKIKSSTVNVPQSVLQSLKTPEDVDQCIKQMKNDKINLLRQTKITLKSSKLSESAPDS